MNRKLVATLACRNNGSRLYGKPLQNLDPKRQISIIDHIIYTLSNLDIIDDIAFAISEGVENEIFIEIAKEKGLSYIIGDEKDVLMRLIKCGRNSKATDIFRVTTESPFLFYQKGKELWNAHKKKLADATFLDNIIDGCGFEIINIDALEKSHHEGISRHRSELCSLYIRENQNLFNILKFDPPKDLSRNDLRLTVDNPEDLIVCREVYKKFVNEHAMINLHDVVKFLDSNIFLKNLIKPYTDTGYATMYI